MFRFYIQYYLIVKAIYVFMYLLSSVAFLLSYFLNEALWLEYLVLKEFSVSPMYVCGESALVDVTVHGLIYNGFC